MKTVRPPAVAGSFYPRDPVALQRMVTRFVAAAEPPPLPLRALIAPHAGYIYSGPIAGTAYACLQAYLAAHPAGFNRVVLLGPAHRAPVHGLAGSSASAFATPLGEVPLDRAALDELLALPHVAIYDAAHRPEHGLEVHLPFLQLVLPAFTLVPLLVGDCDPAGVSAALALLASPQTLILISSDLSHYHDYDTARRLDQAAARAIEQGHLLHEGQACGRYAINGLLQYARQQGWQAHTLDLRSSGDTAGPRDQVVGYGAFAFGPPAGQG
jgi:hypothetical protein